jgi:hypothetical protein
MSHDVNEKTPRCCLSQRFGWGIQTVCSDLPGVPVDIVKSECKKMVDVEYLGDCMDSLGLFTIGAAAGLPPGEEERIVRNCIFASYISDKIANYIGGLFGDISKYMKHLMDG